MTTWQGLTIDGCNPSNRDSPDGFDNLRRGGVTAVNATVAIWEGATLRGTGGATSRSRRRSARTPVSDGLKGSVDVPNVAEGLRSRGYSETDVAKVMGENWLRLFQAVWKG